LRKIRQTNETLPSISGGKASDECTPEETISTFDFMLGLKACYHRSMLSRTVAVADGIESLGHQQ